MIPLLLVAQVASAGPGEPWNEGTVDVTAAVGRLDIPLRKHWLTGVRVGYAIRSDLAVEVGASAALAFPSGVDDFVATLVQIAATSTSGSNFQQPFDQLSVVTTAVARWTPIHGRLSLWGLGAVHADGYLTGGAHVLLGNRYIATYGEQIGVTPDKSLTHAGPTVGAGANLYLSNRVAWNIDLRAVLWVSAAPQYDPNVPVEATEIHLRAAPTTGIRLTIGKLP